MLIYNTSYFRTICSLKSHSVDVKSFASNNSTNCDLSERPTASIVLRFDEVFVFLKLRIDRCEELTIVCYNGFPT